MALHNMIFVAVFGALALMHLVTAAKARRAGDRYGFFSDTLLAAIFGFGVGVQFI